MLLWAFDVVADGRMNCTPETGILDGLAVIPSPFRVRFAIRGEEARKGVARECERGDRVLGELLG